MKRALIEGIAHGPQQKNEKGDDRQNPAVMGNPPESPSGL